ncbi:DUF1444 family protein [Roseovarius sp. CAU 1744]|uniref:DUF1444 family protein n=1 Tax=Roseovarius sp. CAU 1744 TaxID=3140368 RepID=UPI00325A4F83
MKRLGTALVFLWAWTGAAISEIGAPNGVSDTLQWMSEALEAHPETERTVIHKDEGNILLHLKSGTEMVVFPDNLHQKLVTADDDHARQEIFDFHIESVFGSLASSDEGLTPSDLERVFPVIRHREYRETARSEFPKLQFHSSQSLGDSDILYVVDKGDTVSFLTIADLERLKLDSERLRAIGNDNLRRKFDDLRIEGEGVYFLTLDGFYESSFVTFIPMWREIDAQLGEILMAVPARDLVIFVDGAVPESRDYLSELVASLAQDLSYPVSDHLYTWNNDAWIVVE